jgi:hypothetical protein
MSVDVIGLAFLEHVYFVQVLPNQWVREVDDYGAQTLQ